MKSIKYLISISLMIWFYSTVESVSFRETRKARCMPVFYELFAIDPEKWMRRVFRFLEIPFHPGILNYSKLIGKPGGIILSKYECFK